MCIYIYTHTWRLPCSWIYDSNINQQTLQVVMNKSKITPRLIRSNLISLVLGATDDHTDYISFPNGKKNPGGKMFTTKFSTSLCQGVLSHHQNGLKVCALPQEWTRDSPKSWRHGIWDGVGTPWGYPRQGTNIA